jgi:hypothetical protein
LINFREPLRTYRGIQPSVDSLARCAFSAYTLGIKILDDEALTCLLTYASERLNAYAHWEGIVELPAPPLDPLHAILASRALPEPASSILATAFVDLSVFARATSTFDEAITFYPPSDRTTLTKLRRPTDEETIALLQERHSELVDSLLRLARNFGKGRSLAKVGRPCCSFEDFAADRAPDPHMNAIINARSALSIITAVGAELQEASRHAPAQNASQQTGQQSLEHNDKSRCRSCLAELHRGMRRLYGLWWEDVGRLLMGEPQDGHSSVWDDVRSSLSAAQTPAPANQWLRRLECFLHQIYRAFTGWSFLQ